MTFEINVATLIAGALIFLLAIFTKPFVLILRDRAVWWWIEKYLINEKFRIEMNNYQFLNPSIFNRLDMINTFHRDKSTNEYVYAKNKLEIKLSSDEFNAMMKDNRKKADWCVKKKVEFARASSLFNSVVKHYDQEKLNPIDAELANQRKKINEHSQILLIIAEMYPEKVMKYFKFSKE